MSVRDGAEQERKRLATAAGVSTANSVKMSGADLHQAALAVSSGLAVGPGNDGARMMQQAGGAGN
jgi:hypothetical protein